MRTGTKIVLSLGLAALSAGAFAAKAGSAKETLRVGIAFRLDEKYDRSVTALIDGIKAAASLYEADNGRRVRFVYQSYTASLSSVITAARELAARKVAAVIGGEMSEEALALGEILNGAGIVLMTPTASNPGVTQDRPFVFRACFSDTQVADRLAEYTARRLKPKSIGVLHNISSPYSDFLSRRFMETFAKLTENRTPMSVYRVLRRTSNMAEPVTQFKKAGVSHVAMFTHDTDLFSFVAEATPRGFLPTYIGSDGWGSNDFVFGRMVRDFPLGKGFNAIRNSYWLESRKSPLKNRVLKAVGKKGLNEWTAIGFDSAWLLFHAMGAAGNPKSGESIRHSLLELNGLPLLTSQTVSFGPQNALNKNLYLYRISRAGVESVKEHD
jgi:branched-chain amino acid transport system substrate-binding protein